MNNKGFTLPEVVISLFLLSIVLHAATSVYQAIAANNIKNEISKNVIFEALAYSEITTPQILKNETSEVIIESIEQEIPYTQITVFSEGMTFQVKRYKGSGIYE